MTIAAAEIEAVVEVLGRLPITLLAVKMTEIDGPAPAGILDGRNYLGIGIISRVGVIGGIRIVDEEGTANQIQGMGPIDGGQPIHRPRSRIISLMGIGPVTLITSGRVIGIGR